MFPHFDQSEYAVALKNAYRQFPAKDSTLDIDFVNNRQRVAGRYGAALDGVTFTRSTTGKYFGADGLLKTAAINEPRYEYDPTSLRPVGLLIEESRANLLTYSEQFDNAAWTKSNVSVTANAASAPDGSTTAVLVEATAASGVAYQIKSISADTSIYTASLFVRGGSAANTLLGIAFSGGLSYRVAIAWSAGVPTVTANGSATSADIGVTAVGSGWYRVSVRGANTNRSTAVFEIYPASIGTGTCYVFGAQLEVGDFVTSYIPTTSASVTRGADVASMTGANFSSWFNTSGVFLIRADWVSTTQAALLNAQGPTISDRHQIKSDNPIAATLTGGTVVSEFYYTPFSSLLSKNIAYQYSDNNFVLAQNGIITNTDTSGAVPTNIQTLEIGRWAFAGICLNGHLQRITNYKQLPNHILQYITRLTA